MSNFRAWRRVLSTCFVASALACSNTGTAVSTTDPQGVAGSWTTPSIPSGFSLNFVLAGGASLTGTGGLTTLPTAPSSGPATPAYTGDDFTITSGTFASPSVSFAASLGANPDGNGGLFHGTASFSGTVSGNTMTGTLVFTPPRTVTQTFAAQTVNGLTLTRQ